MGVATLNAGCGREAAAAKPALRPVSVTCGVPSKGSSAGHACRPVLITAQSCSELQACQEHACMCCALCPCSSPLIYLVPDWCEPHVERARAWLPRGCARQQHGSAHRRVVLLVELLGPGRPVRAIRWRRLRPPRPRPAVVSLPATIVSCPCHNPSLRHAFHPCRLEQGVGKGRRSQAGYPSQAASEAMNNTSRTGAGAAPWCEAEGGPAPARHRHSSSSAASCARSGAV